MDLINSENVFRNIDDLIDISDSDLINVSDEQEVMNVTAEIVGGSNGASNGDQLDSERDSLMSIPDTGASVTINGVRVHNGEDDDDDRQNVITTSGGDNVESDKNSNDDVDCKTDNLVSSSVDSDCEMDYIDEVSVCDNSDDSDDADADAEDTDDGGVIVISDNEVNDDRTVAIPEFTQVVQTVTLTMRRTTTYSGEAKVDEETFYTWDVTQTKTNK